MIFRVPFLVKQVKAVYSARPVFRDLPLRHDGSLSELFNKLTRDLTPILEGLAREDRHEELAAWTFAPAMTTMRTDLRIELKKRVVKVRVLLVQFRHFGRKMAFCPGVPEVWFEIARGQTAALRAQEVLQDHWRQRERDAENDDEIEPEVAKVEGKSWIHTLTLSARTRIDPKKAEASSFLILGGGEMPDGSTELRRVGRCIDWLYPDQLDRAVHREEEVNALAKRMTNAELRPVLMVGPRQCGKTAILHECVHRMLADRVPESRKKPGQVWLIAPQRLISGMSYVGQWEARLLAILKHARKRRHTLYFDDLVGLFLAGLSSNSTLSAAQVLKPYLEDRSVRVVAEITPEQLRVLRERDRGFADLFEILPVREPTSAVNSRILTAVERRLEDRHAVRFELGVQPAVVELQRRSNRTAAFPGKAVAVLNRLAVRAAKPIQEDAAAERSLADRPVIDRNAVYQDQAAATGLTAEFLDPEKTLVRSELQERVAKLVIGQTEAVAAITESIGVAKARLNDPHRPLASFLFLGPTGVGKTEAAKAAATVLFGDSSKLIRIDLNEYNTPGAAARLVGTFQQPEGLLTSAVRNQPFCVLLLDEIEKAHGEVHDLLLQVLGEGRLTDALGRTADFTNAFILMTSNLGAREAGSKLGLNPDPDNTGAYLQAAKRFFRPEFFNRLDRVIPFHKLRRGEMNVIAERLVNELLSREGFQQRKCVLEISPEALTHVVDRGYDPDLGARAMKRAVERELARPAAAKLAAIPPGELSVVRLRSLGGQLTIDVQQLAWEPRIDFNDDRPDAIRADEYRAVLEDQQQRLRAAQPSGVVKTGGVTVEQERYFTLRERLIRIGAMLDEVDAGLDAHDDLHLESVRQGSLGRKARYRAMKRLQDLTGDKQPFRSIFAAISMEEALDDLIDAAEAVPGSTLLNEIENELALLKLMATEPPADEPVWLWLRATSNAADGVLKSVREFLVAAYSNGLGVDVKDRSDESEGLAVVEFKGFHALELVKREAGTHLAVGWQDTVQPVRAEVTASFAPPTFDEFGPVLRIYRPHAVVDLRSGLVGSVPDPAGLLRSMIVNSLPRV